MQATIQDSRKRYSPEEIKRMKQYFEKYCQESLEEEKETQKLLEEIKIISNKADEYWKQINSQLISQAYLNGGQLKDETRPEAAAPPK